MGKLYTLDKKLLVGTPEIRIGEKVYPVDDRQKTVKKVMKMQTQGEENKDVDKLMDETLKLAFGESFKEIDNMNLPFAAQQQLFELVVAAMTGEEPEEVSARFQEAKQKAAEQQPVV